VMNKRQDLELEPFAVTNGCPVSFFASFLNSHGYFLAFSLKHQ